METYDRLEFNFERREIKAMQKEIDRLAVRT